jgi:hypothetical protein
MSKLPSLSDFLLKLDDLTGQVKTSVQIQHDTISDKIIPLDQYTGDKSCIEKNIYKMPSLDKELTVDCNIEHEEQIQNMTRDVEIPSLFRELPNDMNSEIEQLPNEHIVTEMSSCIGQRIETLGSEMPCIILSDIVSCCICTDVFTCPVRSSNFKRKSDSDGNLLIS